MTRPLIILDPGHGTPDTGAVLTVGRMVATTEAIQNLAVAKTLKFMLENAGYRVVLTRTGDAQPGGANLMRNLSFTRRCDLKSLNCEKPAAYISIHHDVAKITNYNKKGGAYFHPARWGSRNFALQLTNLTGGWCQPDTTARQGSLYVVRQSPCDSGILWEVGPLKIHTKQSRISACEPMLATIKRLIPTGAIQA